MAKKITKKKSNKAGKKAAAKPRAKAKAIAAKKKGAKVAAPKKGAARKLAKRTAAANRRKFRRYATSNLQITEFCGDYRYSLAAGDISEGGIFLKGRMRTSRAPSQLLIHMKELGSMEVTAKPVYDRLSKDSYGTGYQFVDLTPAQAKALKGFLRNLD